MKKLFTSADYLEAEPAGKLSRSLFNIACDLQDMPNINFEMFSLFTPKNGLTTGRHKMPGGTAGQVCLRCKTEWPQNSWQPATKHH